LAKPTGKKKASTVKAAFGAKNRARLLDAYFANVAPPTPGDAWRHVYALLLWIDQTTGLAHCYESDKSQPGKHWYPRSLAFHAWLAKELGVAPHAVADALDWLFRQATLDLAKHLMARQAAILARASTQRAPYEGLDFPEPGEDPELVSIIQEVLGDHFASPPPEETWRELVQRVRQHVTLENKRKNLVGEGFEDVIASIITRAIPAGSLDVTARRLLQTVPGFANEKKGEKPNKVDVVVLRPATDVRTLVTAKWSIRADREKQFQAEFSNYVAAKSDLKPFEYILVTNEFDPARLVRACEAMAANSPMFSSVVHINTAALEATYGDAPEDSMKTVIDFVESGRLMGIDAWLEKLSG
jgi:hypothetical protein